MQEKAQKRKQLNIVSETGGFHADQLVTKQVYNKPKIVSYGPLAKNITLGFLSGAETDSTFAV